MKSESSTFAIVVIVVVFAVTIVALTVNNTEVAMQAIDALTNVVR